MIESTPPSDEPNVVPNGRQSSACASGNLVEMKQHKHVVHAVIQADSLDYMAIDKVKRAMAQPANYHFSQVLVLDLSRVQTMNSLVMGALIQILMNLKDQGRRLMLVGLNARVRASLTSTRIDQLFEIYDDLDQAVKAVR